MGFGSNTVGRLAAWAKAGLVAALACTSTLVPAQCPQVTSWSNADQSYFPAPRVTRLDHSNTPGYFYFYLDSSQDKQHAATYFSYTAGPSLTRDRTFDNSVSVSVMSFRDAATAAAVAATDTTLFNQLNPLQWGHKVHTATATDLVFYDEVPGQQLVYLRTVRDSLIVRIELRSASANESATQQGLAQLWLRRDQAMALLQAKCGGTLGNHAPTIELRTSTGALSGMQFQRDMALGLVLIRVGDEDGLDELDFGTLRVYVAGIDKTAHFLGVVNRLQAAQRVAYVREGNRAVYALGVQPKQLMGEDNLFNIAWNGHWDIRLRICDRKGACGENSYRLYFGPFLEVMSFQDRRCVEGPGYSRTMDLRVAFGNNGYDAQALELVALGPDSDFLGWRSAYWTISLVPGSTALAWWDDSHGLRTVTWPLPTPVPSGQLVEDFAVELPATANARGGSKVDIPAGSFTLVYGAMDPGALGSPYLKGSRHVTLCSR